MSAPLGVRRRSLTLDEFVLEVSLLYRGAAPGVQQMRCLFMDNFRGFRNTVIPLVGVNFLVGENSTGKTSFLTMLRMFSGHQLFMGSEYAETDTIPFGHFEEMVSAHSEDKSYFRLGYATESVDSKKKKTANGILLTYENIEGLAQIACLSTMVGGASLHLRFSGKGVFYKNEEVERLETVDAMCDRLHEWIKIHKSPRGESWSEITPLPLEARGTPLFFLMAIARAGGDVPKELTFSLPVTAPPLVWIAPIRSRPRRTYDEPQTPFSPEGGHIPYVIRRMLSSEKEATKFKEFIERVGGASGLFQKIDIKRFGDSEISPFEVDAYLDDAALGIGWLGYGVSQSLPIFVELLDRPHGSWFAIQQPEVHLHPRAQACVGDVFFEMASREDKTFFVETHSDFIIDRFRLNYRERRSKSNKTLPQSQVLFFERKDKTNVVTPLPISSKGELPADQPDGYRRFFIKEDMKLLGL